MIAPLSLGVLVLQKANASMCLSDRTCGPTQLRKRHRAGAPPPHLAWDEPPHVGGRSHTDQVKGLPVASRPFFSVIPELSFFIISSLVAKNYLLDFIALQHIVLNKSMDIISVH